MRSLVRYAVAGCIALSLLAIPGFLCSAADNPAPGTSCPLCMGNPVGVQISGFVRNTVTGETLCIPIHREEVVYCLGARERAVEIRYVADLSLSVERGMHTSSKSRVDPSVSYRLTLTQYYSEMEIGGWPYVSVSKYVGTWERLDSQVAASDGCLSATAHGWILGGGKLNMAQDDIPHFMPGSYSTRTLVPDWAGTYLNFGLLAQHCGEIRVELYRRTDPDYTWEFWFTVCQRSGL